MKLNLWLRAKPWPKTRPNRWYCDKRRLCHSSANTQSQAAFNTSWVITYTGLSNDWCILASLLGGGGDLGGGIFRITIKIQNMSFNRLVKLFHWANTAFHYVMFHCVQLQCYLSCRVSNNLNEANLVHTVRQDVSF